MNSKHVVSLGLSKALKKAGYPQEGIFWWVTNSQPTGQIVSDNMLLVGEQNRGAKYPMWIAPLATEILEKLPKGLCIGKLNKDAFDALSNEKLNYFCAEINNGRERGWSMFLKHTAQYGETVPDVLAQMYIQFVKERRLEE